MNAQTNHHKTDRHTCIFCKIASKSIPAHIVYEDDDVIAFLDINPIRPGHVQLIPRMHYPYFDELTPELAAKIMHRGQRIARAMKNIHGVARVGFVFTGSDIAHVHAHLVPLVGATDITSAAYIEQTDITFIEAPRATHAELTEQASLLMHALR